MYIDKINSQFLPGNLENRRDLPKGEDDFFDIDLSVSFEAKSSDPIQHVTQGKACSATCVSCGYTCGGCKSQQVKC